MSLRTPLGRVLGLGSAKNGTDHWWAQRVSAVALLLLGVWFVFALLLNNGLVYFNLIRFISAPLNGVLLSALCIALAFHSYLGVQVVIEDYVHTPAFKITSLLLSRFAHFLFAVSAVYAILNIGISV